jgi:hypothetical protein
MACRQPAVQSTADGTSRRAASCLMLEAHQAANCHWRWYHQQAWQVSPALLLVLERIADDVRALDVLPSSFFTAPLQVQQYLVRCGAEETNPRMTQCLMLHGCHHCARLCPCRWCAQQRKAGDNATKQMRQAASCLEHRAAPPPALVRMQCRGMKAGTTGRWAGIHRGQRTQVASHAHLKGTHRCFC